MRFSCYWILFIFKVDDFELHERFLMKICSLRISRVVTTADASDPSKS